MSESSRVQAEQKFSILDQAAPSQPLVVLDIDGATPGPADLLRGLSAGLGVGSFQHGSHQLFVLRAPHGGVHFFAQPFDGRSVLPGEHHVVLPFAAPAPAVFLDSFGGGRWKSPHPGFEAWLGRHPLQTIIMGASWDFRLGAGSVKREWLAQLRPVGAGRSHLVMKATGERAVSEIKPVGFATLVSALRSLVNHPGPAAAPMLADLLFPSAYAAIFGQLCESGQPLPLQPYGDVRRVDLVALIMAHLGPAARGKLCVHPIPQAKEASARRKVLPPPAAHLPILALLDLTLMGSASDALVLTPSHGFVAQGDLRASFAWGEVRGAQPPADAYDDRLAILLAERGWLSLPVGDHAMTLFALMSALAAIPAAG